MGDARQAINALQNMPEKNFVLPMRLFVLLLHVSSQLHGLRKRLVAFGQLLQTLIDIHLTNSISEAGFLSGIFPNRLGNLISMKVSRLYAFSAYPDQTALPSYATGVTTGSQEVCSGQSGSSRTLAHSMLVALCASSIRSTPLKFPAPTTDSAQADRVRCAHQT